MKKVFTKINLRWGYNNIWIKEGNKWKAVFMIPEGSFEPTVMFFGLTNSPAIFQAMMNKLLRDLINMGKVVAFIDDVIVEMEDEEEYNKLVAEIMKRLGENNLYMKLEKCKWKVRKVGFLGVVIGPAVSRSKNMDLVFSSFSFSFYFSFNLFLFFYF